MPDTKSPENETEEDDAKGGGGGKRIAIAGVLSVGLLGGGYFAGGGLGGGDAAAQPEQVIIEVPAEPEKKEIGHLVDLDPVNVNLQDGHYLRIAIALEVHEEEHEDGEEKDDGHGKAEEDEEKVFPTAPAADLVVSTFSGRTMEELAAGPGRESARTELFEAIEALYGEKVTSVYLTEFVMQ